MLEDDRSTAKALFDESEKNKDIDLFMFNISAYKKESD